MPTPRSRFSTAMDTARVAACFMVVMLHTAATRFGSFDEQWWASNFYDSLVRSCVPLFLMITGVLLLGKRESLPAFLSKRFARVLPPLVFWSLFYMAWNTWRGEHYGPWYGWLEAIVHGPVVFHLWYLYAIVGIYLFVPFLRSIWNAAQPGEKLCYLALWAGASAWPTLGTALGMWWQVRTAGSRPVVWGLRKGRPCLGSEAARPRSGGGVGRGLFVPSRACCSATGLGR